MDSAVSSSPFLRSVVEAIRVRHYSIRTEKVILTGSSVYSFS